MQIEGLDHLVLTVADVGRTRDFYERVLRMKPVVFGEGRHTLAFRARLFESIGGDRWRDQYVASSGRGWIGAWVENVC